MGHVKFFTATSQIERTDKRLEPWKFNYLNNHSTHAAIYLAIHSPAPTIQLSSFLDSLLLRLQQRAQMPAQRNLSIFGRSLVANMLLLGPLWHANRVFTDPQILPW
ncbi:hypothetical protein G6F43_006008 [Rhizopus delemar]|nr:hypothetical protein G6F43_006008 [Rhizopus delemar]